jgi:ribosomal protein S18 acetylase RimI-like enzyme
MDCLPARLDTRAAQWYIVAIMVRFLRVAASDADKLAAASKSAFENDIHYGAPSRDGKGGGPPGYDSPGWQRRMMRLGRYYKILVDDQIMGGFIVFPGAIREYELGRIFIHADLQNQGIGTQAMEFMFGEFPLARTWLVGTPAWNRRTRHFYEKAGFEQVEIRYDPRAGWDGVIYKRIVPPRSMTSPNMDGS